MYNFVPQLTTWHVVSGESVMEGHMETHLHHLQLTTWQVVAQNCAFLCVPNSHQSHTLDHGPRIFPMSRILEINLWKSVKSKFHISTIKMSFPNKITQSYENEM